MQDEPADAFCDPVEIDFVREPLADGQGRVTGLAHQREPEVAFHIALYAALGVGVMALTSVLEFGISIKLRNFH